MKFRGAEQAIRFAYNISERAVAARPSYGQRSASIEGLSPFELHAQGAMIMAAVDRLSPQDRGAIVMLLGPTQGARAVAALEVVHSLQHDTEGSFASRAELLAFISGTFVHRLSVRGVAAHVGCSYRKARDLRNVLRKAHASLYVRAIELLEADLFREGGLEYPT